MHSRATFEIRWGGPRGKTLTQIRKELQRQRRLKREGWWTGQLWNILDTALRYNVYEAWPELQQERKLELLAKARAEDTMKAWEIYLAEHPTK